MKVDVTEETLLNITVPSGHRNEIMIQTDKQKILLSFDNKDEVDLLIRKLEDVKYNMSVSLTSSNEQRIQATRAIETNGITSEIRHC